MSIIKKIYNRIMFYFNPIKRAKKLGVKIYGKPKFFSAPDFGSEPWLITIEDKVSITSNVRFITHDGSVKIIRSLNEKYNNVQKFGKIWIKENSFIGTGTYILPDVIIGKNSVVGAGSVVTKDVPDNTVVAGVPAKPICSINELADKYLECTPLYKKWKNREEKIKVSSMIADNYRKIKEEKAKGYN